MDWAEPLPESCPPQDARNPNDMIVYRIIEGTSATENDFISHRKKYPSKFFKDECIARSLSVFDDISACKMVLKLPNFRNSNIVKLTLDIQSGVIKKTFKDKNHYSWWMAAEINPVNNCKLISE